MVGGVVTMYTLEEQIKLITAFEVGKPIQFRYPGISNWSSKTDRIWDFDECEYRIVDNNTL